MMVNFSIALACLLLQLISFINYIESYRRIFIAALESISSYEMNIQAPNWDTDIEAQELLKKVISKLRESRLETEIHSRFIQQVIDNIPVGILVVNQHGKILLSNKIINKLFDINTSDLLQNLGKKYPLALKAITSLAHGDINLFSFGFTELRISSLELGVVNNVHTLFTIESIGMELDAREIHSWNKIIRIMTHEILNSLTPITSLVQMSNEMLLEIKDEGLDKPSQSDLLDDVIQALNTVTRRSEGLNSFVSGYRKFSQNLDLKFSQVSVNCLFDRVLSLYNDECSKRRINLIKDLELETLQITADELMIEHVLINLLTNSMQACEGYEDAFIKLSAENSLGSILITVEDNGAGIDDENVGDIFVPFFSTKKNGEGIGLSLCKQIIRAHNAQIYVHENSKPGARIQIRF